MELVDFMNREKNWKEVLAAPPYCLTFQFDGEYVLAKYQLGVSDLRLSLVQEARGSIFVRENGVWKCVCRAMDKFFNWGEDAAATIDWASARVLEKVDGSLIKVWYYNGWHVSTNNTIDAAKNEVADGITFRSLFDGLRYFQFDDLDTHYCYWFELVSKWNPLVVQYEEEALYYLGCRNMETMKEESAIPPALYWQPYPRSYNFSSLADTIAAANQLQNAEGYVVVDGNWNRIKVKGEEYLRLAHIRGNNLGATTRHLVELWKNEQLDDFVAICPQFREEVLQFQFKVQKLVQEMDKVWNEVAATPTKKELAAKLVGHSKIVTSYCFAQANNKAENAVAFLQGMRQTTLEQILS